MGAADGYGESHSSEEQETADRHSANETNAHDEGLSDFNRALAANTYKQNLKEIVVPPP